MWLQFSNDYSRRLWVAIGYYSPGCSDGGDWAKEGWWQLDPGQSATVLWTTNEYATFYAEAEDGENWSGPYGVEVPLNAFDWCWSTGTNEGMDVGMRLITITGAWAPWVGTINLVA